MLKQSQKIEDVVANENPLDCEREWSIQNPKGKVLLSDPNLE